MKKTFTCLTAAALLVGLSFRASTSSSTPPTQYSGAPGEATCTSCHSSSPLNSGSGSVTLLGLPAVYVPGATYVLQVKVTDATKTRFGFEMAARNSSNAQAGTFSLVSSTNTAIQSAGGKAYAMHRNANSNNIWSINWQAPASNVGPVKFYLAGNAANGNNSDTGDLIYTSSFTLNPATNTGIEEDQAALVTLFPNPASENLQLTLPEKPTSLKVLDAAGKQVFSNHATENLNQLNVSQFPNGTYFLEVGQKETTILKRFVVQH